jgi:hypothetical protein
MSKRLYAKWMRKEDDQLRTAAASGEAVAAISKRLCRSERAVRDRALTLGVKLPSLRRVGSPYRPVEIGLKAKGEMMAAYSRVFTLEVDGRPILTFEAGRTREAQALCKEPWLHTDLRILTSNGVPLMNANAKLSVRPASVEETNIFGEAAAATQQTNDMVLTYLVELDS